MRGSLHKRSSRARRAGHWQRGAATCALFIVVASCRPAPTPPDVPAPRSRALGAVPPERYPASPEQVASASPRTPESGYPPSSGMTCPGHGRSDAYQACEAMRTEDSCKEAGGTWTGGMTTSGMVFVCSCPPPDRGCPCKGPADCVVHCVVPKANRCRTVSDARCGDARVGDCFVSDGKPRTWPIRQDTRAPRHDATAPSSRSQPRSICGVSPAAEADFHGCEAMADEASCKGAGGDWATVEVENSQMAFKCVCPLLDTGCPCATSSDCEDACIVPKANGCTSPVGATCGRFAGSWACLVGEHGEVFLGAPSY